VTDPLRQLDERIVPALAAFFDRVIPRPPEPAGPLPFILRLRRVDDRWTQRGPLALVREVPQLGALVIAALVLASGVAVANRRQPGAANGDRRRAEQGPGEDGETRGQLGPTIGESVPAYLDSTRQRLLNGGIGQPDGAVLAVVSFAQYRTAKQIQDILGPASVARMFYRVPVAPLPEPMPGEIGVVDFVKDAKKEFLRLAIEHEQEAKNLQGVIETNEFDPAQKAEDEKQRDLHLKQARMLRGDCACIYGVIVQTKLRVLIGVVDKPGVRAVDASALNARIGDYDTYSALLPEEKVTVTGGNQA
jgi:hypothetical protein